MGLFSSKTVTHVDTQVVSLVDDNAMPDTMKEAVIRAIIRNSGMSDTLVQGLMGSPVRSFDKMHKYGRTEYTHGLPNTALLRPTHLHAMLRSVIGIEEGVTVSIEYARFAALNNSHHARQVLADSYGYNGISNEIVALSQLKKAKVYLKDIVPCYREETVEQADPEIFEPFGDPESGGYSEDAPLNGSLGALKEYTLPEITSFDGARVEYTWREGSVSKTESLEIRMTEVDLDADYYQVKYRMVKDDVEQVRYWTYRSGAGRYRTLDLLFSPGFKGSGTYFPFVFFRSRKENLTASWRETTELYKTSSKMVKYIGIDYGELGKEIHNNPDVGQIEQAVLTMGVRADSKKPVEVRYLFEYFRNIAILSGERFRGEVETTPPKDMPSLLRVAGLGAFNTQGSGARAITLQDRDFRQTLRMSNIQRKVIAGRIGVVGTYASYTRLTPRYQRFRGGPSRKGSNKSQVYRKQVTDSTYEEVWVSGLALKYDIWEGHSVTARLGEDRLLIPIDRDIAESLPIGKREKLYMGSLHLVFNSRVTQKVKWYQRGAFKVILVIVAIAIAAYTGRFEAVAAAIAAGEISAVVLAVLTEIVLALAMQEAFKFVAKELGAEFAFYLAIAAALYSGWKMASSGSLNNATALELLQVSSGLSQASQNEYLRMIQDYQGEMNAFNLMAEQKFKELEDIRKSLETQSILNPFEFVGLQPFVVLGESPDMFYQRTVHSGNIGARQIDALSSYFDDALRLPTPQDTLGGVIYV